MGRWALTGPAYSGKTTLGHELERRGYVFWSYTDYLKQLLSRALGSIGVELTEDEIHARKQALRRLIIPFSETIGFDSAEWVERFIDEQVWPNAECLADGLPKNLVWDNCRYPEQYETLKHYGFRLLRLDIDDETQRARAAKLGVSAAELAQYTNDASEQPLPFQPDAMRLDARMKLEMKACVVEVADDDMWTHDSPASTNRC